MEDYNTNWSNDELKAYLLLYCANADFIETNEERDIIKSKVDKTTYNEIHKEFDKDNDYQSLQKILSTVKRLEYSQDQISKLITEMKDLFLSDSEYDQVEKNLMLGLKHLLS
jgi:hypothetical protein